MSRCVLVFSPSVSNVTLLSLPAPSCVSPSTQLPPGLLLFEDFISAETEQLLLRSMNFEEQSAANTGPGLLHIMAIVHQSASGLVLVHFMCCTQGDICVIDTNQFVYMHSGTVRKQVLPSLSVIDVCMIIAHDAQSGLP